MKHKNNFPDERKKNTFSFLYALPESMDAPIFSLRFKRVLISRCKKLLIRDQGAFCGFSIEKLRINHCSRSSLIADAQFDGVNKIDGKTVNAVW